MATVQEPAKSSATRYERFVQKELSRATRRVQFLDLARAGLGLAIVTMAYGLAMMLLDKWLTLPQLVRQIGLFGYLAFFVAYSWFVLLRPFRRKVNPYYAAVQVEQTVPDAKNSLVNWLDLHDDERLGAGVLAELGHRAAEDLKESDVQQAIRSNALVWLGAAAAILIVAFLVTFGFLRPDQFRSLLSRTFSPFDQRAIAKQTTITMVSPAEGYATVPINRAVTITVNVNGRIPAVNKSDSIRLQIRRNLDDPNYEDIPLEQSSHNQSEWSILVPPHTVSNGFYYRVVGGDDATPEFRIKTHAPPSISRFEGLLKYRPYLRWDPRKTIDPNIEDYVGTEVTLDAYTNRTVREGRLLIDGANKPIAAELVPGQPEAMRFKFKIERDAKYRIWFTSAEDETNSDPLPYTIKALRDQIPEVAFTKPEDLAKPVAEDLKIPADGTLKLEGFAQDDFGITKMTLRMKLDDAALEPKPYLAEKDYKLDGGGYMRKVEYKDFVDLAQLKHAGGVPVKAATGMILEFWLEAEDNFDDPAPQVGSTKHFKARIIDPIVRDMMPPEDKKNKEEERANEKKQAEQDKAQHDQKHEQDRKKESAEEQQRREERQEEQAKRDQEIQKKIEEQRRKDEEKRNQEQNNNEQNNEQNAGAKPDRQPENQNDKPKNETGEKSPKEKALEQATRELEDQQRKNQGQQDQANQPKNEGQQDKANQPNKEGQQDKANQPKNEGQQDKANQPNNQGQQDKANQPNNQGQQDKANQPMNQGQQDKANQPNNQGQQDKANQPKNEGQQDRGNQPQQGENAKAENKPAPPDGQNANKAKEPEGQPKQPNGMGDQNKPADMKPAQDQNKNGGPQAGENKNAPQQQQPRHGENKKPGEASQDPNGKGDPMKKPPQGGDKNGASEAKQAPAKSDKPMDGMGDGPNKDPKAQQNQPGTAKGQPKDQQANQNQPGKPNDPNAKPQDQKPGEGGMAENKPDNANKPGAAKDNPPKNDAGNNSQQANKQGQQPAGENKPKDGQAAKKADAKPDQNAKNQQGQPNGDMKPGNNGKPQDVAKAGEQKPPQNNPMGQGQQSAGEPKPDQGKNSAQAQKSNGGGGGQQVDKLADQMKKGDAQARADAKQKLNDIAKNDPDPQKRQAAEDALKNGEQKPGDGQASAKSPPQQGKPGDPMGQKPQQVAEDKAKPDQNGKPGDMKPGNKGNQSVAKSDQKGPPSGQGQPKSDAKSAPKDDKAMADAKKPDANQQGQQQGEGKKGGEKDQVAKAGDPKQGQQGNGKGEKNQGEKNQGNSQAGNTPPKMGDQGQPGGDNKGEQAGVAKGDPSSPGQGKPDDKPGQGGGTPGNGTNATQQVAGRQSPPEDRGKITDPNQDYKNRSGELKLENVDKETLKKLYQKYNITEEEMKRYLADQAKARPDPAKAAKNNLQTGNRSGDSALNQNAKRIQGSTDENPESLRFGRTGSAPPEYKEAAEKFSKLLGEQQKSKSK